MLTPTPQDAAILLQFVDAAQQHTQQKKGPLRQLDIQALEFVSQQPRIVGDVQRKLGVLPAQMSRVLRRLEAHRPPLVSCTINLRDKRNIDVTATAAGIQLLQEQQAAKIRALLRPLLSGLETTPEDLQTCERVLLIIIKQLTQTSSSVHETTDRTHD